MILSASIVLALVAFAWLLCQVEDNRAWRHIRAVECNSRRRPH